MGSSASRIERGNEKARAIIHKGVLIQSRRELHGIHLGALAGQAHAVALGHEGPLGPADGRRRVPREHLVDGLQREGTVVEAAQLVLDAARAQFALPAQGQNPPFFLLKDFLRGTVLGPPTLGDESFHSLLLIAPYPLAQGRSRDATAAADQPCIVGLLVEADPC